MAPMGLRESQTLFVACLGELFTYATRKGYKLTLAEGFIATPRKSRDDKWFPDGVHMENSLHYDRLAQDMNLFVGELLIRDSSHPIWLELGKFWEGLSPECAWGGRFSKPDAGHFSIRYGNRA